MLVFVEGGKPENPKKNAWSKARTNNKLNPHVASGWNRTQATLVEGERHYCSPRQTAIQLQRANKTKKFKQAHPQFIFDTSEVILFGQQIGQGEVESLACVIFIRSRSLDMKHSAVFTADEYALWSLVANENKTSQ